MSIYFIHNILSYFFGEYYNTSNYDVEDSYKEKGTENYLRESGFTYFSDEHFSAYSVGKKFSEGDEPSSIFKYSSDVKLISRYGKEGFEYNPYLYDSYHHSMQ